MHWITASAPAGTSVAPSRTSTPSRATSRASHATSGSFGPATAAKPPNRGARSTSVTACPRIAATRAASSPAGPPPTTTTERRVAARRYQSGSSVSRPDVGSPMHVTSGLRTSRTWQVWLQRVHGRIRAGAPARSLATRSGSAICARVISTPAHRARSSPPSTASASPGSTTLPCRITGTSTAPATAGGERDVERGRLVKVGTGLLGREDRAADDSDVVDPLGHQRGGDARCHLRRDPRPWRELVAGQTQAHDPRRADGLPDGGDHLAGEARPVGAPLVVTMVGQPRQELADEAVLTGVHLDAVASRIPRDPCCGAEAGDHGGDVVRLHPLRHLARHHLRDPRRRPERRLAVRRRTLAAGVIEGGDDERAVAAARGRDRRPSVARGRRQRRSLVRPVRLVHARALDDDRAATAAGPPLVVGDVARGKPAVVVAEVGDVGSEEHPVGRGARPEAERREETHAVSESAW